MNRQELAKELVRIAKFCLSSSADSVVKKLKRDSSPG